MRASLALMLLGIAASSPAGAQTPRPRTPPPPPPPPPAFELLSAKPTAPSAIRYLRTGADPLEYRVSNSANLSWAAWSPLTETDTSSFVKAGVRYVQGTLHYSQPMLVSYCGDGRILLAVHLQLRTRIKPSGTVLESAVRGDTACVQQ